MIEKKSEIKEKPQKKTYVKKTFSSRRKTISADRKREFDQKIINIRRVTRVVAGGRRFSFSVAVVVGNKKGQVGVGVGKASDTSLAIEKAVKDAKKHMIKLNLTENKSIPYELSSKYCAANIILQPAYGRGRIAGSSVRNVLELGGVSDVNAKILSRSKNKLNNAQATMKALRSITLP